MSIQFFTHIYRLHALPMHLWLILLPLPQVIFLPKPLVYTSFLYSFSTFLVQTALVNFPCYDFVMEMASEIKNEGVFFCNWGWFKALSGKLGTKIVETARKKEIGTRWFEKDYSFAKIWTSSHIGVTDLLLWTSLQRFWQLSNMGYFDCYHGLWILRRLVNFFSWFIFDRPRMYWFLVIN